MVSTASSTGAAQALRASNNYLGQFISGGQPSPKVDTFNTKAPQVIVSEVTVTPPPEEVRAPPSAIIKDEPYTRRAPSTQPLEQDLIPHGTDAPEKRQPRLPQLSFIDSQGVKQNSLELVLYTNPPTTQPSENAQQSAAPFLDIDSRRPSVGQGGQSATHSSSEKQYYEEDYYDEYDVHDAENYQEYAEYLGYDSRRLTMGTRPLPPDDPTDNPEQRANRIRSFYKEYFDDTKPQPQGQEVSYYDGAEGYYDNHGLEAYQDQKHHQQPPRGYSQAGRYGRHRATASNGTYMAGPRAFSSVSGQHGQPPVATPKKRFMPPPTPLNLLPTPSKLKDDNFMPIDFAPPSRAQDQRSGTPTSLRGGMKPYSPSFKPHVPLASSFDDLAVMPSPYVYLLFLYDQTLTQT
jgi:hypothetical protein